MAAMRPIAFLGVLIAMSVSGFAAPAAENGAVNLYSYRQQFLMRPLLDAFTAKTGIRVNFVYAKKGILERLKAEGLNSPADVILTADVGRLDDMAKAGLLQPVKSPLLEANIPPQYRDPGGLWFGLTTRARVIIITNE